MADTNTTTTTEKVFNTRLILKNATEAEQTANANFVPKKGELIIYNVDSDGHNNPRLKIGDGTTAVNDLPFVAATVA